MAAVRRRRAGGGRDRAGHRAVLLRGRRRGARGLRDQRAHARPQGDRPRRAWSRRRRRRSTTSACARCASGALLLPPPRPRRDRPAGGGRVAELIRGLDARRVGRQPRRACGTRSATGIEVLAAVKYVARRGAGRARRGRGDGRRREPRAGARGQGAGAWRSCTWDFIGHLQSRKVKQILPLRALIHSVATDSALAQLGPARRAARPQVLVEVNVAGEREQGAASRPRSSTASSSAARSRWSGLMTMPPFTRTPEDSRRWFARAGAAGGRARAARALDGHHPGLRGRRPGGRDDRADRHELVHVSCRRIAPRGRTFRCRYGVPRLLAPRARLLRPRRGRDPYVRRGRAYEPEAELEDRYRERPNVRRLARAGAATSSTTSSPTTTPPRGRPAALRSVRRRAATAAATCACTS